MDELNVPSSDERDLSAVPLFPLPNVVLFPRAVLPLHIFEQRYRAMTADALNGSRQIAMALLRPGWEKHYHSQPQIEPIVCVGTILSHEQLPDGKYNFLLQGMLRARVVGELPVDDQRLYRVARLEVMKGGLQKRGDVTVLPTKFTVEAVRLWIRLFHLLSPSSLRCQSLHKGDESISVVDGFE